MVEGIIRNFPLWVKAPAMRYYGAAVGLVHYYVPGRILIDDNDTFLRNSPPFPQGSNWEYVARVTQLASVLFSLRSQPGFDEICRRLATRDLRQAHSEMAAAGVLLQHNFTVESRPETGFITKDFDFTASHSGNSVNVEVWQCDSAQFNEKTLLSRLKDKRKQLPADKPAVIMCIFPDKWYDEIDGLNDRFDAIAERFFGGTSRINFVIFVHEEFGADPINGGGYLSTMAYAVPHHNPRFADEYLKNALLSGPSSHPIIEDFIDAPKTRFSRQSQDEFHQWVNWLIDGHV